MNTTPRTIKATPALLAAVLLLGLTAPPAAAQSGAGLLLSSWEEGSALELRSEAYVQGSSHTRDGRDDGFQLRWYEAGGRYRFNKAEQHPAIGFELDRLDLDTSSPRLPERLVDQSAAVGVGVGQFAGWKVGLTAGGGFAGDTPYSDEDALYATANLILTKQTSENAGWQILLNYDGNRTFLPDVPLPGLSYYRKASDRFRYTIGLPYSAVTWRPLEPLTLNLNYTIPFTVNATAEWALLDPLTVFGAFRNRFNAYHLEEQDEHRRLFFEQRRIEAGVRYEPHRVVDVTAAAGLAFDQEFNRGYDSRDLEDGLKIANAPFFRVGVDLRF